MSTPQPPLASRIRVLVIDDHPMLRAGLIDMISGEADLCLAGECDDGAGALNAYRVCQPDVTIMDIAMPRLDGVRALEAILQENPQARVVMLTAMAGDHQVRRAMAAGAAGFLLKSSVRKELLDVIRAVHGGARGVAPTLAQALSGPLHQSSLSEREIEVLRSAADGNSNKHIAADLGIAEDTVKTHMRAIFGKLNARDRTQAVTIALRRCMISL